MKNVRLATVEEFKAFCESEKEKEKAFIKNNDACYYKAYKYFENYTCSNNYNILDSLIDDIDFLEFPLDIEIIENPLCVEVVGFSAVFFKDPQKALEYGNKLYKEGVKSVEINGKGISYEYDRDFCYISFNDDNQNEINEMLSLIKRD